MLSPLTHLQNGKTYTSVPDFNGSTYIPNVHPGPQTDGINVRQDGTHIFQAGLTQHAALWRAAIYATLGTLFPASVTPIANFIMNSPSYPLQTAAGYSEYRWNNFGSPPSAYSTTGDGFCYVKDVAGNWYLTPQYLRTGFCGLAPEASPDQSSLTGKDHYQLKVSPNPSKPGLATITFIVKQQGNIRITLLDQSGNSVENVMDGLHKVGKFEYRIKTNLRPGTYFCQLQAEMIGITHRFFVAE